MLEIQNEQPEQQQRLNNFTVEPTNSQFPLDNNNNNNNGITTFPNHANAFDSGFPPPPPPPPPNPNFSIPPPPPNPNFSIHHPPPPPRKRPWGAPSVPDQVDATGHVKVYVAPVPRTASESDVRLVFEGYGTIVEVVLLRDKKTGARQGSCLVKYSTFNEADMAIKALSNQYTFPGESFPVVVRFADRDRERFGLRGFCRNMEKKDPTEVVDKVFVGNINKETSRQEIEEIFSPYGHIEDVVILPNRGYCFVKFSSKEMALAAIKGLNRTFTMRGCDQPVIVRFAEPKKPKMGESRGNYLPANANYGPNSQEPAVWPLPNFCDPSNGGSIMHNGPHHSRLPHQQVNAHMPNWEPGATVVQQQFLPQHAHSHLASMPLRPIQAPTLPYQPFNTEVQRQFHPADLPVRNIEQQLSSQLPTQTERNNTVAGSTTSDLSTDPQDEDFSECDWSEHYCPDGNKYYYNCVTCESRWEKPEEYALYDKESQKQHEQDDSSFLQPQLSLSSSQEVSQRQQETNHDHMESETSPVVEQV
ncbi:flowering time control protein FCA [Trifolium repens]|nr:flowering time control protein FCA [Trifolium repens]